MKIFCHECGKLTNHREIAKEKRSSGPEDEYSWGQTHYFAVCAGCDAISYAIETWEENDWDPETGDVQSAWQTYPRSEAQRQRMNDVFSLPPKVRQIYEEVIGAMNAQLPVLAGMGLRALIESICKDKNIAGGNLEELIGGLATGGILSTTQADILHAHRFLGNAAAHEITPAKPRELVAALEIAESVLRTIYILPGLSNEVKTGRKP